MGYGGELGYIVLADAPNPHRDLPTFQRKAMEMRQIDIYARRIQSKHALFLFDACFSGSLFALSRAVPDMISANTAKPVRQFITSDEADEAVEANSDANSDTRCQVRRSRNARQHGGSVYGSTYV